MNIILTDLLHPWQLTSINQTALTVAVLAFGMLCVYRLITDTGFVSKLIGVLLLVTAVYLLAGCNNGPTNPLGMTDRTRLRTDASVSVAQVDAQARIAQAQADANARIAQAQAQEAADIAQANAQVITEQSRQNGATARTMTWATTLPIILLIIGVVLVVALVVNWQGRIHFERIQLQRYQELAQPPQWPQLNAEQVQLLRDHAAQTGKRVIVQDGQYYLTDGQRTVKALLKG